MTGKELVAFAESKLGTAYVYGMKGKVMTKADYERLKTAYGDLVWDSDRNKIGKVCVDCSGLIGWATGKQYGTAQLYEKAIRRERIQTIAQAPIGALVWKTGHVGIYLGLVNGEPWYIAADGSAYGVRKAKIKKRHTPLFLMIQTLFFCEYCGASRTANAITHCLCQICNADIIFSIL